MQFAEGISFVTLPSPPSLSISRGKIFGRCAVKGGLRLFVSVRNSAQVSDIRCMFLDFARLLIHIPRLDKLSRVDENEGGDCIKLHFVSYHARDNFF